jgi:hypothetical protein
MRYNTNQAILLDEASCGSLLIGWETALAGRRHYLPLPPHSPPNPDWMAGVKTGSAILPLQSPIYFFFCLQIHPYIHNFCNNMADKDQLTAITFPDIDPNMLPEDSK